MSQTNTDQLYIDDDYLSPDWYYTYVAEAVIASSSTANISCDASVIIGGEVLEGSGNLALESSVSVTVSKTAGAMSNMTVTATVTATISHIEGADMFAFSNAQLAADVAVIKSYNISSSSAFSIAVDAVRGIYISAQADSVASMSTSMARYRATEAAANAAFSLSASANKTVSTSVSIASSFTPTVSVAVDTYFWVNYYTESATDPDSSSHQSGQAGIQEIAFDSSNNPIAWFKDTYIDSSSNYFYSDELVKFDKYGNIAWRNRFTSSVNNSSYLTSSSPDDYWYFSNGNNLIKFDQDGALQWQKNYSTSICLTAPFFDSDGNVYTISSSASNIRIIKFDKTNGNILWNKLMAVGDSVVFRSVKPIFDSQGYLIVTYSLFSGPCIVAKINVTNWTIVWIKSNSARVDYRNHIDGLGIDKNNNVYIQYSDIISLTSVRYGIAKFNSSGTFQWAKYVSSASPSADNAGPESLIYDNLTDRLYVGNTFTALSSGIAAFDLNGNNIWQTEIGYSSNFDYAGLRQSSFRVDPGATAIYGIFLKTVGSTPVIGIAKLPLTGSGIASTDNTFSYGVETAPTLTSTTSESTAGFTTPSSPTFSTPGSLTTSSALTFTSATPVVSLTEKIPVTDGSLLLLGQAAITTTATLNSSITILKGTITGLSSDTSLTASADKFTNVLVEQTVVSLLDVSASRTRTTIGDINSEINLSSTVTKIHPGASDISSTSDASILVNAVLDSTIQSNSNFTQIANNVRTRNNSVQTDAIFSELAAVAKIGDFLITMESQAALSSIAVKTVTTSSTQSVSTALSAEVIKAVDAVSSMSVNASQSADAQRFRSTLVEQAAEFTQTASLNIVHGGNSSLSSEFAVESQATGEIRATANLTSTASFSVTATRFRTADSSSSSSFSTTATVAKTTGYSSSMGSNLTLDAIANRVQHATITTDSIASQLSAVAKTGRGFITCEVQATLVAGATKIARNVIQANISTQIAAVAVKTARTSSTLATVVSSSIEGTTNITLDADLSSEFALSCNADYNADAVALVASSGNMTALVGVVKPLAAGLSVTGFELAVGSKTLGFSAALTANASMTATLGGVIKLAANLQGFSAELVAGKIIHIDPQLTWIIPADTRVYSITQEDREYTITDENRLYTITG